MLKMLLPKGHMLEALPGVLSKAGIAFMFNGVRDYHPKCSDPRIEATVVSPRSIPWLLAHGDHDVGFCGLDLLEENQLAGLTGVFGCLNLGLNPVEMVIATHPVHTRILEQHSQQIPLRVATEYLFTARHWAHSRQLLIGDLIHTHGCTEAWVPGNAEIILDITATGRTLEANELIILERLKTSTTWLLASGRALADGRAQWLIDAIQAVITKETNND